MFALLFLVAALGQPADLVIENARIWSDGQTGFAEFAAVREGRFIRVGRPDDALIGPNTQHGNAGGRIVLPGLIDSHINMLSGGKLLTQLQLRDARDKNDFVRRIEQWCQKLPPGKWVTGGRWSTESWAGSTSRAGSQPSPE